MRMESLRYNHRTSVRFEPLGYPMQDVVTGSIPLGRWFGTKVRLHWLFPALATCVVLQAAFAAAPGRAVIEALGCMGLLFLAVVLRETGQLILMAQLGGPNVPVRLWPLGSFVAPGSPLASRTPESAVLAASSLATSLALTLGASVGLLMVGARPELNPFGGAHGGAPLLPSGQVAPPFTALWWIGWFGWINGVLFLANLIPALPFDMGRVVRGWWGSTHRETEIFPYLARVFAALVALVGLTRLYLGKPGWPLLLGLGVLIECFVRLEARQLDETGSIDGGMFGYDFSQGYTSLEAGPSVVRPRHSNALRRWQERRSELRRQRREAQVAADESRLDEILAKLHRDGRESLAEEEHRFLARASNRLRHRRPRNS